MLDMSLANAADEAVEDTALDACSNHHIICTSGGNIKRREA